MSFPQVRATTFSVESSNTTSHAVSMAGVLSGDRAAIFIVLDGFPTLSSFPSGWVQRKGFSYGVRGEIWEKIVCDGTETDFAFTSSSSEQSTNRVFFVSGSSPTQALEVSAGVGNNSTSPDPDALTVSWGTEDNLWIAFYQLDGKRGVATAYPANYTSNQSTGASEGSPGNACGYGIATRELAATTQDPGSFTKLFGDIWGAMTIAIRPTAVSTTRLDLAWLEQEAPESPTRLDIAWTEQELPTLLSNPYLHTYAATYASSYAHFAAGWLELETPSVTTRLDIAWIEGEVPDVLGSLQVAWMEQESPNATGFVQVSWLEGEVPAPTRIELSWVEQEFPHTATRFDIAWLESETPSANTRLDISWFESEIPDLVARLDIAWTEQEVADAIASLQAAWVEQEIPHTSTRVDIAWTEQEVGASLAHLQVSWLEQETPDLLSSLEVSWSEVQVDDITGRFDLSHTYLQVTGILGGVLWGVNSEIELLERGTYIEFRD